MTISSVASTSVQPAQLPQTRPEGRVEGNKPDGDGDQDDLIRTNSVAQANNTSQVTESLGNNVNVIA
jgi:hypothetical protein